MLKTSELRKKLIPLFDSVSIALVGNDGKVLEPAVERTGQAPGLSRQVKVQIERVQVRKQVACGCADGLLGNSGEDSIAHLAKQVRPRSRSAVTDDGRTCRRRDRYAGSRVDAVHNLLKVDRHLDVEQLADHEQRHCGHDTALDGVLALGPQRLAQGLDDLPIRDLRDKGGGESWTIADSMPCCLLWACPLCPSWSWRPLDY